MQVRSIPSYQSVRDTNEDGLSALTARPVEGIHALHARQSLEAQLHRFTVPPSSKAPRVVPAGRGYEYLAALRAAGDPGCQDDCPAEKVVFSLEDVARVQPDPHKQSLGGLADVVTREDPLKLDRAIQRRTRSALLTP